MRFQYSLYEAFGVGGFIAAFDVTPSKSFDVYIGTLGSVFVATDPFSGISKSRYAEIVVESSRLRSIFPKKNPIALPSCRAGFSLAAMTDWNT